MLFENAGCVFFGALRWSGRSPGGGRGERDEGRCLRFVAGLAPMSPTEADEGDTHGAWKRYRRV